MTSRQENIRALPAFAAVLVHADAADPSQPGRLLSAVRATVSAECIQCGITVSGDELLALASPPPSTNPNPNPNPKVDRLRLGYCARSSCNSSFYRILLPAIPNLDWDQLLPAASLALGPTTQPHPNPDLDDATLARRATAQANTRRALHRAAAGAVIVLALLLARHWYRGGSIPLLREPEKFQVDVDPIYQNSTQRHR